MSTSSRTLSPKGLITTALVAAAVAAVIVAVGVKSSPSGSGAAGAAAGSGAGVPAGSKAVAITKGALATDESVTGSLVFNKVTLVLHRIEGQTTSLSASAAAGRSPSAPTSNNRTGGSGTSGSGGATTGGAATGNVVVRAIPTTSVACGSGGGSGGGPTTSAPSGPTTPTTIPTPPTPPTTLVPAFPTTTATGGAPSTSTPGSGCSPSPSTTVARSGGSGGATGGASSGAGSIASTGGATSSGTGGSGTRTTQVITSVLGLGAPVSLGTVLYTVESQPVVAMAGALPAWRTLTTGITDGPDVEQLEKSLVALGYDRDGTMTVDQHFDTNTANAVKRWQTGYGLSSTGKVTLGQVVFLPTSTVVSAVSVKVGDTVGDGDGVLSVSAASQQVIINVPTGDESFVVPGLKVGLGGSGSSNTGTVSLVTSATQSGSTVVEAIITPDTLIESAQNGATVKVHITQQHLADVLLVPTVALASRLDGRYSIQLVDAAGVVTWHDVTVLGNANGMVAIKGVDGDNAVTEGAQTLEPL